MKQLLCLCISLSMAPVVLHAAWNNPYPAGEATDNILYTSFAERPKKLDPARSYSSNEYVFIGNIYEPPFQYHYLKRPYELEPLTAIQVPRPVYYDKSRRRLPANAAAEAIAYSVYRISIKRGILYQPHPALAINNNGEYLYHNLGSHDLEGIFRLDQFEYTGTRELKADDYVYQIKRLAHPRLHSPIFSLMAEYIVGLRDLASELKQADSRHKEAIHKPFLDLRQFDLEGVKLVDDYTYEVTIRGKYPQFLYWMAMPFFSPIPWEADMFFSRPGMAERNLSFNWYAIGTGAYMLTRNDPNRKMVLERNPNYRDDFYPARGTRDDRQAGLLNDAGRKMPFVDKVVFSLEKESIPYWNKFLQGYYDRSGISAESFDQAIQFSSGGDTELTAAMKGKGIELLTTVASSTYYFGFNMLDPVVGGYSERARKLRRAISIAIDYEEQISIFLNGRGIAAQGPLPPGIFGYLGGKQGINSYVYDWINGKPVRKSIDKARRLLVEAGYADGVDPETGERLLLYFDTTGSGPEDKARLDWMRKQFEKLKIQLVIRPTDYNRFQDKMRNGSAQMFVWGWNADYPDPENFLFLLYGPNSKVKHHGENAANYNNPQFNLLYEKMKDMKNSPARQKIINRLLHIARRDAPWAWGLHPKQFVLQHEWVKNARLNLMAHNTLKYLRVDPAARQQQRELWNRPVVWPVILVVIILIISVVPAVMIYKQKERQVRG